MKLFHCEQKAIYNNIDRPETVDIKIFRKSNKSAIRVSMPFIIIASNMYYIFNLKPISSVMHILLLFSGKLWQEKTLVKSAILIIWRRKLW